MARYKANPEHLPCCRYWPCQKQISEADMRTAVQIQAGWMHASCHRAHLLAVEDWWQKAKAEGAAREEAHAVHQ